MVFQSLSLRLVGGSLFGFMITAILSYFLLGRLLENHLARELDESLKTEALDVAAALEAFTPFHDKNAIGSALERFGHTHGIDRKFFRFYNGDGQLLGQSDPEHWTDLKATPDLEIVRANFFSWTTQQTMSKPQGVRIICFNHPDGFILQIGVDRQEMVSFLKKGRQIFAGAMAFIVIPGSLLGWLIIRKPIQDIGSVAHVAHAITDKMDFQPRVVSGSGSVETRRLASAFNTMLDKIQELIQSQKEIMDNIAHDIRSPVARMRSAAESSLSDREDQILAGHVIEDCDHILNLINILLDISATESGLAHWESSPQNLGEVLEEALEMFAPLFEMKDLNSSINADAHCLLFADRKVLQRLISNLLDNAVKYSRNEGSVEVTLKRENDKAILTIRDTGMGISEEALPRIFDRFYRGDSSRTEPGSGLGLSFCRAAVTAMKGDIHCSSQMGVGTVFTVILPLAP